MGTRGDRSGGQGCGYPFSHHGTVSVNEVDVWPKGQKGFAVSPWQRVVERTFAWLGRTRRRSKDDEGLPGTTMLDARSR